MIKFLMEKPLGKLNVSDTENYNWPESTYIKKPHCILRIQKL